MRLRYLYLPRCGPLTDTAVVFGREDLIAKTLNLRREGSLNFMVGVNGSGKSSLLRTLYRTFRSLNLREWPALPVTLAWDRSQGAETITTILHSVNVKDAVSFFATLKQVSPSARQHDWEAMTNALGKGASHPLVESLDIVTGPDAITSPLLFARLPKRLIAYTSGSDELWEQLHRPDFHPREGDEGLYQTQEERPQGWSMAREWANDRENCVEDLLTRYVAKPEDLKTGRYPGMESAPEQFSAQLAPYLEPLLAIRSKVQTNRMPRSERLDDSYFRIQTRHLRLAGITLALWQTAKEMTGRNVDYHKEALRNTLLHQRGSGEKPNDARRVLNEIDWFWPTHLSITYHDSSDDRVSPRQHEELLCLVSLADEVLSQPRGRMRAIFSLGPGRVSLTERLKDAFPLGTPGKTIEFIAERVDGCPTMAEAILRILSEDKSIDSTPMDVFARLRDWERTGLLEDLTLTVKRIHRPMAADGEPDDTVVTYDQLSDGEQMLLGRMGLLFLLRGQDGSLLLLDEPETHFNDVWKREIVEMVDVGLLNSTAANVVVATHTSIALTDAFAAEVTVLDKTDGHTTARGVTGGLFGTDPGEVNMNLFRAESTIGRRSAEILDSLLKEPWKGRETELEAILNILGSSFHRAELRALLKQLKANPDGTPSR